MNSSNIVVWFIQFFISIRAVIIKKWIVMFRKNLRMSDEVDTEVLYIHYKWCVKLQV